MNTKTIFKYNALIATAAIFGLGSISNAQEGAAPTSAAASPTAPTEVAQTSAKDKTPEEASKPKAEKGAPLPLHTIEGYGGVLITPTAYLVNPTVDRAFGEYAGLPSASVTYVNARQKNVTSLSVTETVFERVELGFAASRFGTGSLQTEVLQETGLNIDSDNVWLYNFNVRVAALKETEYLPALTAGVHFKYNDGIADINRRLLGTLSSIGYNRDWGVEFTLTATKAFDVYGHPLIFSVGGRASDASQLGYLGFSGKYDFTVEGNVIFGVTDWLLLAFEYRQKPDPYGTVVSNGRALIGQETDWWTIGAAFILDSHTTLTAGYGHFGQVLNTRENAAWAVALKYEF